MNELNLDIEESLPKWASLQVRYNISCSPNAQDTGYVATYTGEGGFVARIDGVTRREAVVALIHRLQLPEWQEVSVCASTSQEGRA
jgi:hypothetical protein